MRIVPKLSDKTQIPEASFLENFIFYRIELKYAQKIENLGPLWPFFMTVYLFVK